MNISFWKDKKVFITGHTGFKGSWLCLLLHELGATVTGFAKEPPTDPSLFDICNLQAITRTTLGDIRDLQALKSAMVAASPDLVIHMAAQSLVRESYASPRETYETNVMGTVNILEAVRDCPSVRALINVTTDKCYENREWIWSYRETEPLGGCDPYSSSKACSELVTAAYRSSFFSTKGNGGLSITVATARAGNVIGGGDWAKDRLIPDCIKAAAQGGEIIIRNPKAVRPWQHVLEPLTGYLTLAEKMLKKGFQYAEAWNFGPDDEDMKPVVWVASWVSDAFGIPLTVENGNGRKRLHEASILRLDSTKARLSLGWRPRWDLETAVDKTIRWYRAYMKGEEMRKLCLRQIEEYQRDEAGKSNRKARSSHLVLHHQEMV